MNMPLSHNLLGKMMGAISEAANLSSKYTNHCVRSTSICRMKASNIEDRKICSVSGHKNISSLEAYDRISSKDVHSMARAIDFSDADDVKPALARDSACAADSAVKVARDSADSAVARDTADSADSSASASSMCAPVSGAPMSPADGLVLNNCTNVTFNMSNSWHTGRKRPLPFSLKLKKKPKK